MDFLNSRLIAALNHLRAEVHSLRDSIDSNCSEYRNEHERRHTEMLRPVVVNAELQVPEATEREKARRDDRTHRQQVWLTWGTWLTFVATTAAFAAAAYYAHIARKTFDQIKIQTQAIAGVDHAKIYAAYVQHNDGDFWIVGFRNVGRVAAPTLTVTYSIVLFDFNRGQTIQTFETGKFTSAEVVPSTNRGENDIQKSFLVPGSSHLKQATSKQTVKIQGSLAYENGFGETVTQDFCQEMVPFSNPADPLGTWNTCDQGAVQLEKLRK